MGAEYLARSAAPLYAVQTAVVVDATPMSVWKNVMAFPPLAPPAEWYFRAGIAYPERARIVGSGTGAVRYCEFSTGSFIEPVTSWVPGTLLAFDVTHNPEPMREWSPYGPIETPHLNG
ncbi:MAG: hypothetical protein GIW95_09710 [Candidatus Eremiobacteraeota bacterium]|nr:hypothetical protein [Candidatus Eremiobacteraeota bacterium]